MVFIHVIRGRPSGLLQFPAGEAVKICFASVSSGMLYYSRLKVKQKTYKCVCHSVNPKDCVTFPVTHYVVFTAPVASASLFDQKRSAKCLRPIIRRSIANRTALQTCTYHVYPHQSAESNLHIIQLEKHSENADLRQA